MRLRYLLCAVVLLFPLSHANAQRKITSREGSACPSIFAPPETSAPPIHTGMPMDCILGYIYYDSLCRANFSESALDSFARRLTSIDTMKKILRLENAMITYDASLFDDYLFIAPSLNPTYKTFPGVIYSDLRDRCDSLLGGYSKIRYLSLSDVILHISVLNVAYDTNKVADLPVLCISAAVLDTIKGSHFFSSRLNISAKDKKFNHITQSASCQVKFIVSPEWQRMGQSDFKIISYDATGKREVSGGNQYGGNAIIAGGEYIVVLNTHYRCFNGTTVEWEYWPAMGYSIEGGIFPIDTSGNVSIPSNFFGYGTTVPLPTCLARLRSEYAEINSY